MMGGGDDYNTNDAAAFNSFPPMAKMADISQTMFSDAFSWMKSFFFVVDKNVIEMCS